MTDAPESVKGGATMRVRRSCRAVSALIDCGRGARDRAAHPPQLVLALTHDDLLTPGERFALELLVDLSAVLRCDGEGDVVRLRAVGEPRAASSSELRATQLGTRRAGRRGLRRSLAPALRARRRRRRGRAASDGGRPVRARAVQRDGGRPRIGRPRAGRLARCARAGDRRARGRRPAASTRFVDPWPNGRRWALSLTHDLDVVEWWPAFTALRLAELLRHGELDAAGARRRGRRRFDRTSRGLASRSPRSSPRSSVTACARRGSSCAARPTLATARAGDLTYRPDSAQARRIFDALRAAGHEIGLHGSFATSDDHARVRHAARRSCARSPAWSPPACASTTCACARRRHREGWRPPASRTTRPTASPIATGFGSAPPTCSRCGMPSDSSRSASTRHRSSGWTAR